MPTHRWNLDDAEFATVMALQRAEPAPPRGDPVWLSLIEKRLVSLDVSQTPPALMLTPLGWRYPENSWSPAERARYMLFA